MTAGQEPTADPGNQRDDAVQLPKDALRLFQEVATGYDKSQTGGSFLRRILRAAGTKIFVDEIRVLPRRPLHSCCQQVQIRAAPVAIFI